MKCLVSQRLVDSIYHFVAWEKLKLPATAHSRSDYYGKYYLISPYALSMCLMEITQLNVIAFRFNFSSKIKYSGRQCTFHNDSGLVIHTIRRTIRSGNLERFRVSVPTPPDKPSIKAENKLYVISKIGKGDLTQFGLFTND